MTTDAATWDAAGAGGLLPRLARGTGVLATILLAWLGISAGAMRLVPEPPAALVLLPSDGFLARLPAGTGLVDVRLGILVVQGRGPSFVADLYAAGAGLVLPARASGCLGAAARRAS